MIADVIDARGRTRVAVLRRMLAGPVGTVCGRAGLAVDLTRARAYVVAPGGLVAAVDLRTMHVRYHAVSAKRPASRDAVWLGNGRFAFASNGAVTLTPAGATVVDAERWSSRIIDPRAGAIQVADGKLLTYEGIRASGPSGGTGVHAYRFDGSELWHLFDGEHVVDVQNANGYLYVRTAQSTHVVDAGSGAVVADLGPVAGYLGFLAPDR